MYFLPLRTKHLPAVASSTNSNMEHKLHIIFFFLLSFFIESFSLKPNPKHPQLKTNITVIGSVFCDTCSENAFSKHSYFLPGVQVLIQCKFAGSSGSSEEITVKAKRTTDGFGVYKLDIPPVEGFQCRQGLEIKSVCSASLIQCPSSLCSIPGRQSSTAHMAIKSKLRDICILNLNTLNYHPLKRNDAQCGVEMGKMSSNFDSSLCFWPFFPPFGLPWPNLPFPFPRLPLPDPSSLPFSLPSWLLPFFKPPYLPFPFSLPPTSPPAP
ncbi:hypothetical protein HPP92_001927 [Vanilla planifolia]|uniref:Pollen Ole e 1 allergen and extensin family protein n=1 Tax=Vanilla planifolia TaxID=51239 RepID=A0A835RZ66_VANPL|nr:hypothetical protein HPP92_001927 [Vanilla planifolia]